MMLPQAEPARKPRRLGLFGPFALLLVAAVAWSVAWFWLSGEVGRRMDAEAGAIKAAGGELSWKSRQITGYPFRLDIALTGVRAADGSGWALETPRLEAEAFPYALNHWVMVAPNGVTVMRPVGGPVSVSGEALRASVVSEAGAPFPRLSVEGVKLAFATPPAAQPFWMDRLDHLEFHFRPGPSDQGALLLRLDGARPRLSGLMARIAQDKPVELVWDSTFSHASSLKGRDWAGVVRAWSAGGGRLTLGPGSHILAGEALLAVEGGDLGVDVTGRLSGHLDAELKQAPRALAAMGEAGAVPADVATVAAVGAAAQQDQSQTFKALLLFENGQTKLGPLPLAAAPRVY